MADRDTPSALILDRYWDEVLAGTPQAAADTLDPDLVATVRRVHALDRGPTPSPRFASHLWEELVHTQADAGSASSGFSTPSRLWLEPVSIDPRYRIGAQVAASLSRLAAAVILLALIAVSAIAALYPLGVLDRDAWPAFMPANNPPKATEDIVGKRLLSLTLPDWPTMRTFGGITLTDYPVDASSQERTRTGPQLFYIALGSMSVAVTESRGPVVVIPLGGSESTEADVQLGAGDEADLSAGTTIVAPSGSVLEMLNIGTEPARMLVLLGPDGGTSDGTARDGATWRWGSVGMPQEIAPPVHIDLRQITLNPSAALPIPPAEMGDYSAAVLDGQRVRDLSFAADLGWRNTSFAPLEAYLLKITSGAAEQD